MKKNMGRTDVRMRVIAGLIIIILYFFGLIQGTIGPVLLVIAGVFLITSGFRYCPLYGLFGFSTCRKTNGSLD